MATGQFEEYRFPDEQKEEKIEVQVEDSDVEVKIVDDTPQEDRFVEPLTDEIQEDLEAVDESDEYSHNVKLKFKQYKKEIGRAHV